MEKALILFQSDRIIFDISDVEHIQFLTGGIDLQVHFYSGSRWGTCDPSEIEQIKQMYLAAKSALITPTPAHALRTDSSFQSVDWKAELAANG